MTIELVSFNYGISNRLWRQNTIDIINESKADLLMFAGSVGNSFYTDLSLIEKKITNKKSTVVFEIHHLNIESIHHNSAEITNWIVTIQKGKLNFPYTFQLFAERKEASPFAIAHLLKELSGSRVIKLKKNVIGRILQCGEISLLKNKQAHNNVATFAFEDDEILNKQFEDLFANTQIFLNPIHCHPMGNQGKMHQRRISFSQGKRLYISAANAVVETDDLQDVFKNQKLHYLYYDGQMMDPKDKVVDKHYLLSRYSIPVQFDYK